MRIVNEGDPGYDAARAISNLRFDYRPKTIFYCESAEDVRSVIGQVQKNGWTFRIRAGGHQHEGMCSANGARLIDVSSINSFDYREAGRVWIGAGAALKTIYDELWEKGFLFPGGACGDVHVGGLTQGGGWGLVSRMYGLTCDSLLGVEIVTAKGEILEIPRSGPEHKEDLALLKALRGGGGGNFGVVTKYCFRLHPWSGAYTDVTLKWSDEDLPGDRLDTFVLHWIETFPNDFDHKLSSFLRIGVTAGPVDDRLLIGGKYLGNVFEAEDAVKKLLGSQPPPREATYQASPPRAAATATDAGPAPTQRGPRRRVGTHPEYQPGPEQIAEGFAGAAAQPNLADTCAGTPIRHKVSSGFAKKGGFNRQAVETLTGFIRKFNPRTGARQYVSLHCLGGAINKEVNSSYAFRDRDVLLQYQAWWLPDSPGFGQEMISWILNFRKTMAPYTDGAFINFVDRFVPFDEYYKGKLSELIAAKKQWDPFNFFKFEMSIPTRLEDVPQPVEADE